MRKLFWYSRVAFLLVTLFFLLELGPKPQSSRADGCSPEICQRSDGEQTCYCTEESGSCTDCYMKSGEPACGHCVTLPGME
jgi:hypothetical protein